MKSLDISTTLRSVVSALAEECAKLDPVEEKAAAEEFLLGETEWPAYDTWERRAPARRFEDSKRIASLHS